MFPLNDDFPNTASIEFFSKRYRELEYSALASYLSVFRLSAKMQNRSDAYFQRLDLSQGRFMVMMMLMRADQDGLSPADIAQSISCSRATVTGLLDTLESSGYIDRHADSGGDRRSLTIRLTEAGRQKLDAILPAHYQRISEAMAEFSEDERQQLIFLINKFSKGLVAFEADSSKQDGHSPHQTSSQK